jgi:archaeal flagellin FlaB
MNALRNLHRGQRGMTGLETAIILIAFVTVAAVFGYAVLSAGLFSAERGKETIYAGLSEAKSNMEVSGSVMATSNDSASVRKVLFSVKNAIAGAPIDMTPCNGTSSAANKCVISLTTGSDYLSNIKWTKQAVGTNNNNNLLEQGEQFEITVDLMDLGDNISLSDNLTASDTFTLQVKPAIGASISIKRTLPAAIGPIMDLDLMTCFGGGTGSSSGGGSPPGGGGTPVITCTKVQAATMGSSPTDIYLYLLNTGTAPAHIGASGITIAVDGGGAQVPSWSTCWDFPNNPFAVGETCRIAVFSSDTPVFLHTGQTFTMTVTPDGGSAITITRTLPGSLPAGYTDLP